MNREEIIQTLRKHKGALEKKFYLQSMALFGSYARNEQTETSDVDVMVEFSRPVGIEFIDLGIELEELLKKPVDLVTPKGLKSSLKPLIEKDLVYV